MGCDIHLHVEILRNGRWLHWSIPRVERSYQLFERMAGVRGDRDRAIAEPRGFPERGVSEPTSLDFATMVGDAHSTSWLNSREIVILEKEFPHFDKEIGYLFGNGVTGFINGDDSEYRALGVTDVRIVFWFDN